MLTTSLSRPFPDADLLALDIETDGLNPRENNVIVIAISDGTDTIVYDVRNQGYFDYDLDCWIRHDEAVGDWLRDHVYDRTIVAHNASFDLVFLREHYGVGYPEKVWDTMLAERLVNAGLDLDSDLSAVSERRLGFPLDKTLQTSFTLDGSISPEQVAYAAADTVILPEIARQQRDELVEQKLGRVWQIERDALPVFAEMEYAGVKVDLSRLEPLLEENRQKTESWQYLLEVKLSKHVEWKRLEKYASMEAALSEYLERLNAETRRAEQRWYGHRHYQDNVDGHPDIEWETNGWNDETVDRNDGKPKGLKRYVRAMLKAWREENPRPPKPKLDISPINLNSVEQVKAAFQELGLDLPNLRSETIAAILPQVDPVLRSEVLEPFRDFRKGAKLDQAFGATLIAKLDDASRLHGNWNQLGAQTGRQSCSGPNLLNMPRNGNFRGCFVADEGYRLVIADYSQMELRILAELSGDQNLMAAFEQDLDLHTYTAALVFYPEMPLEEAMERVTKEQRHISKTANFLRVYGGGPKTLASNLATEGVYLSIAEAKTFLTTLNDRFPDAESWLSYQRAKAVNQGWTATPLGRRRNFDTSNLTYERRGEIERAGANHPIQGANADVTKMAMATIHRQLHPVGRVVLQVYDEIVVEVESEHAEAAALIVRQAMLDAAREVLQHVPVKVDCFISPTWNEEEGTKVE